VVTRPLSLLFYGQHVNAAVDGSDRKLRKMVGIRLRLDLSNRKKTRALQHFRCMCAGQAVPFFPSLLAKCFALLLLIFYSGAVLAEGTKQLAPSSTDVTMIYANEPTYGFFASYNGPEISRLYIHISNPDSEQVFFGFSRKTSVANGTDGNLTNTTYYFRVKDPAGNVVYGPQAVSSTTANTDTWALAAAGPAPVVGSSGYTPFTFSPAGLQEGDYYIEFSTNLNTPSSGEITIKYWDITVATTGSSPQALDGRVWSKKWSLRTPSISQGADPTYTFFDRPFNGKVFLYTFDGFVSEVDFNGSGFRGLSFNLAYNEFGIQNTGNFETDRRSIENSNNTLEQYKIFLNNPDPIDYPTGIIGELVTPPVVVDCDPGNLCISYSVTEPGVVFILLDFNSASGPGVYDPGTADVLLYQKMTPFGGESAPYERCVPWDGQNGLGNAISLLTNVPIYLTYAQGMVHFPVYDVEYNVTGYNVAPVRPVVPGFTQKIYYDDGNIPDVPGNGAAKVMVNGCAPPCHAYTNFGYGDLNTINTWWYTNQDVGVTIQLADCSLNAVFDTASTTEGTAVLIDVLENDFGDNIDSTTLSSAGVLQAASGTISINPLNGNITYTPSNGFVGLDSFEYIVCNIGGGQCDTAQVLVTVSCASGSSGHAISGIVFKDYNKNQVINAIEPPQAGVTVRLFQDNNQNGLVDGGDTQTATAITDSNGEFTFSPNLLGTPQTLIRNIATSTDDAEQAVSGGATNTNSTDLELGDDNGTPQVVGLRFQNIAIPPNAVITDVRLSFYADGNNSTATSLTISGQAIDDAPTFSTANFNISNRTKTSASVSWPSVSSWSDNVTYQSPNLSAIVQELVNRTGWASGNDIAFIIEGTGRRRAESFDGSGGPEPQLSITYAVSSLPAYFALQVDTGTLPGSSYMTTDNVETAVFTASSGMDCANNFGFVGTSDLSLAKTVDNAAPNVGDTVVFTINVINSGPENALHVEVLDTLPAGLLYISDDGGGDYDPNSGIWTIGPLNTSASATLNITAEVAASGSLKNMAQVSNSYDHDPDSSPANDDGDQSEDDEDAAMLTVPEADLSLSKTVVPNNTTAGGSVTFTLTLTNGGPDAATNVEVTDVLPAGFVYQSDNGGGSYNVGTGVWTIASIASGASTGLQITALANTLGVTDNYAEITESLVYDPDSAPGNAALAEDDLDSACVSVKIPLCPGSTFAVTAPSGLSNYQWYRNGAAIAGANAATYLVSTVVTAVDTITFSAQHPVGGATVVSDCPYLFIQTNTVAAAGSNSPVCQGDMINLTESGGPAVAWSWAGPASFSSNAQNPTISNAALPNAGTYTVTITDNYGCTASQSISINVNLPANAGTALANDSLCLEGSGLSNIDLFGKLTGESAGGTWSVVSGSPGLNFNASTGILNPNGLPIDTYTFRYTVTGNPPCINDTEDWTITIYRCCPPQICLPVTTIRNN
jgi:uncharacterized repeat protein (TIGR01451 family)